MSPYSVKIKSRFSFVFLLVGALCVPTSVFAANTHHFVCSDSLTYANSGACSGSNSFDLASNSSDQIYDTGASVFPIPNGTFYVWWATGDPVNGVRVSCTSGSCGDRTIMTGHAVEAGPYTCSSGPCGFDIIGTASNYSITDFCISDTSGDCAATAGGGGSSSSTVATSSIATTSDVAFIANTSYHALVLFFISLATTLWMSRMLMQ